MKSKINKSVKPYLSLYEEAKSKGIEDIEKAFWYEYLAYCNYSERTNHIFCGYLEGIGTHDRAWMLEKDKELIKSGHADCIRFIPIISFSELDELITVCMQNNVNLGEKRHLIGVFGAFLSKNIEKDCIFELSIDAQIFFLNLLVKAVSQNNINDIIVPEDLKIYEYFLSNLKINSATEASVATACIELVECFRKSDCSEQKELVKSIRDFIYVRFPDNKKKYESKKDQIIERFFKPLVSDYLCAYSTQLENFTVSFPCLWKNFIEPLQALSFSKTPLYRFFCEPIFFSKIFIFLENLKHKRDGSKENDSEQSHLQHLEGFFAQLSKRPDCSNFSRKVSEFVDLMSSNSLNNIIGASLGLYGEINTLEKVWALQAVSRYSSLVEIPLDSDSRNDKKIVDVRLFFSETNTYQYFESKCKKPGLGFDGEESKLNDYLMHVVPLILDYINICVRSINIDQLFPRISRRKPTPFGALSDFVKSMSEKGFRVRYSENELSKIDVEKEVIKNFLDCFFDEECIEQEGYPLPSPQGILNHYKRSAEPLFRKNFFKNTIKASLKKFQGEGKRARESNSSVASYVICWTFFHSGSLIDDPFLTENGRKKLVKHSEDEIRKIFNEVVLLPEFLDLKNQKTELLFL